MLLVVLLWVMLCHTVCDITLSLSHTHSHTQRLLKLSHGAVVLSSFTALPVLGPAGQLQGTLGSEMQHDTHHVKHHG